MFSDYDMWKLSEPDDSERLHLVAECETCGEEIFAGEDAYWIEIKGEHQLRFCSKDCAIQYCIDHNVNPVYVSWIEADDYTKQMEDDDSFVSAGESWE